MGKYTKRQVRKVLEREFIAGTIHRVDMDRVDVIPNGSMGAMRSLPLTGDRDKVQPGDPVKVINIAGQRVALAEDVASMDTPEAYVVDASEIVTAERISNAAIGLSSPEDKGLPINADKLGGYLPAASGADAHIPVTDTNGSLALSGSLDLDGSLAVGGYQTIAGRLVLSEIAAPATPPAGTGALYMGQDSWPKVVNDGGETIPLGISSMDPPLFSWNRTSGVTVATIATFYPVLVFRDAVVDVIDYNFILPEGWGGRNMIVDMSVYPAVAVGSTVWNCQFMTAADGGAYGANARQSSYIMPAASAIKVWSFPSFSIADLNAIQFGRVRVYRDGTSVSDTLANNAYVNAIRFRVV